MSESRSIAWFDCGTTNTRLYLVEADGQFHFYGAKSVGSRNVALTGSCHILAQAITQLFQDALQSLGIRHEEAGRIRIYASGMITSPFGLKMVPHLVAPVSVTALRAGIAEAYVEVLDRNIFLIPGVRTAASDWRFSGNVRGEETEVFGAAAMLESRGQCSNGAYILPGSHTQILYLKNGKITDILSLFTGELFHALREETILSGVLKNPPDSIEPVFIRKGCADAVEFGINRSLYLCHSNQIFQRFTSAQRYSYAEGVILSGVYQALIQRLQRSWASCPQIVMVCDELHWNIYGALLQNDSLPHVLWLPPSAPGCFGVRGLCSIVGNEGVHYE